MLVGTYIPRSYADTYTDVRRETYADGSGYGGGDEMKVIQRHVPDARLYVGADRVKSARLAEQEGASQSAHAPTP